MIVNALKQALSRPGAAREPAAPPAAEADAGGRMSEEAAAPQPRATEADELSVPQEPAAPPPAPSPKMAATHKVFAAIQGHWLSACLHVMLDLQVPDVLSSRGQAMHIEEIAAACGCASPSHLYKILRVAAQHDLLEELPGQYFTGNEATAELVQDTDTPSLGHMAHHLLNTPKWKAWEVLPQAVKQGKVAFELAHGGLDVYKFGELPEQAAFGAEFMSAMSFFTQHSLSGGTTSLKDAYDWASCDSILDVGGGRGELLSTVMSWAGPDCKGLLLDVQMVIDSIDIPAMFEAKGVTNARERLQLVVSDVRQPFPAPLQDAKVTTLMMKHFLSAFSDDDAVKIISHCKQVLAPQGSILLLQTLVPEPGDNQHNTTEDGVAPGLFAIEILAMCPGGAWRTLTEWRELFHAAGMELSSSTAVGCNMTLMVWRPLAVLG